MSGEKTPTPAVEFPIAEIEAILERATVGAISAEEYAKLKAVIATFALLKEELQAKKTSIQRLKRMLFGPSTEKTSEVLGEESADCQARGDVGTDATARQEDRSDPEVKPKGWTSRRYRLHRRGESTDPPSLAASRGCVSELRGRQGLPDEGPERAGAL
jgi:hypothetical protein